MNQNPNRDVADTLAMVFERIDGLEYRLHIIEKRVENEGRCMDDWMEGIAESLTKCEEDLRAIKNDRLEISASLAALKKKTGINL